MATGTAPTAVRYPLCVLNAITPTFGDPVRTRVTSVAVSGDAVQNAASAGGSQDAASTWTSTRLTVTASMLNSATKPARSPGKTAVGPDTAPLPLHSSGTARPAWSRYRMVTFGATATWVRLVFSTTMPTRTGAYGSGWFGP